MSSLFDSVHFLRPAWLWALLALPLLWGAWRLRQRRDNAWREVVDAHLLAHLLVAPGKGARSTTWVAVPAFVLATLALAGPSWRQVEQPVWQSQAPLVVALDMSSATTATDLPPSRLLQARAKLRALLEQRGGGQVALVVYAGEAFTVAPLTDDSANVALFLDALDPAVMPVDGQNMAAAIDLAVRLMQQAGFARGDILVLGDHAGGADRRAAANAQAQGFRTSAIGLGTTAGGPYRDSGGRILQARLDASSLAALARAGGGVYAPLAVDARDLEQVGALDPEPAAATGPGQAQGRAWEDGGYWLLPPLMLLMLLVFRRGGEFAAVVLAVLLVPVAAPVKAAERDWWQRPDQRQHQRLAHGADAYRKGDHAAAEKQFEGIDNATGHYNTGNALARQGRLDEAIDAYDRALRQHPGMEDAVANRAAVDAARKRRPPPGPGQDPRQKDGQNGQPQQGNEPGQKDPPSPGQPDDGPDAPEDPAGGGKPDRPADEPPKAQPPEDPASQQAADAAQREQMRRALNEARSAQAGGAENPGQAQAQATESAEERERQQAIEAWLRRVPDDPGGLLKAKFRLEHERRMREGQ